MVFFDQNPRHLTRSGFDIDHEIEPIVNGFFYREWQGWWPIDCSDWAKDPTQRLEEFRAYEMKPNPRPFAYSGCATQTDAQAIGTTLGVSDDILVISEKTKEKLFTEHFPFCTETFYPAAPTADGIDSSGLTALCMALNDRSKKPNPPPSGVPLELWEIPFEDLGFYGDPQIEIRLPRGPKNDPVDSDRNPFGGWNHRPTPQEIEAIKKRVREEFLGPLEGIARPNQSLLCAYSNSNLL